MWTEPPPEGWIDGVDSGWIWGRVMIGSEEYIFDMKMEDVLECQRGYIEPGVHVSFPNAHLLVGKTIFTTHDVEQATIKAKRLHHALGWDKRT